VLLNDLGQEPAGPLDQIVRRDFRLGAPTDRVHAMKRKRRFDKPSATLGQPQW
jgi:hypothetical protein